jgi:hydrogenase/urease accessory protein HupE
MEVAIFADRVTMHTTVSSEEVLVAATSGRESRSHLEMVRAHGAYLLAHLQVTADGRVLDGHVLKVPERAAGRPSYELEYRFPAVRPSRLVFHENVLRDIEFAPGNPWEASYLVRIVQDGQPAVEGLLLTYREPLEFDCHWDATSTDPRGDRTQAAMRFVRHGVTHILTGYDHLLFVGALVLAVASLWDLVKVISAFTLAHSISMAVSALDLFRLPAGIVEPMIAASIVVVAAENVILPLRSRGQARLLIAFGFGLFHGLGFAGGLLEAMSDLNVTGAAVAIGAFSTGVEIGHQAVVLPAFGGLCLLRRAKKGDVRLEQRARRYGSIAISLLGMFYLFVALRSAT